MAVFWPGIDGRISGAGKAISDGQSVVRMVRTDGRPDGPSIMAAVEEELAALSTACSEAATEDQMGYLSGGARASALWQRIFVSGGGRMEVVVWLWRGDVESVVVMAE